VALSLATSWDIGGVNKLAQSGEAVLIVQPFAGHRPAAFAIVTGTRRVKTGEAWLSAEHSKTARSVSSKHKKIIGNLAKGFIR
jgi:hypothetical protein